MDQRTLPEARREAGYRICQPHALSLSAVITVNPIADMAEQDAASGRARKPTATTAKAASVDLETETWAVGLDYTTGPFKLGASYYI